jgi:hypothetical protein
MDHYDAYLHTVAADAHGFTEYISTSKVTVHNVVVHMASFGRYGYSNLATFT